MDNQPQQHSRRDLVRLVEHRIQQLVIAAPGRQQDRIEKLHSDFAVVRREIARQGHKHHANVQAKMTGRRNSLLPAWHCLRQRGGRMHQAPAYAQQDQQADDQPRAFVQVDVIATRRRVARNVAQPPAENELSDQQHGDKPVQQPGRAVVACVHAPAPQRKLVM